MRITFIVHISTLKSLSNYSKWKMARLSSKWIIWKPRVWLFWMLLHNICDSGHRELKQAIEDCKISFCAALEEEESSMYRLQPTWVCSHSAGLLGQNRGPIICWCGGEIAQLSKEFFCKAAFCWTFGVVLFISWVLMTVVEVLSVIVA